MLTPHHMQGARDFIVRIGAIMFEVDRGRGAIIFAASVNHRGLTKTATVFCKGFGRKKIHAIFGPHATQRKIDKKFSVIANQCLWQRVGLRQKKPMIINLSKALIRCLKHGEGR